MCGHNRKFLIYIGEAYMCLSGSDAAVRVRATNCTALGTALDFRHKNVVLKLGESEFMRDKRFARGGITI